MNLIDPTLLNVDFDRDLPAFRIIKKQVPKGFKTPHHLHDKMWVVTFEWKSKKKKEFKFNGNYCDWWIIDQRRTDQQTVMTVYRDA